MLLAASNSIAQLGAGMPPAEPLWTHGAPGALGKGEEDTPALFAYLIKNGTGTAVVICPGGSYRKVELLLEGDQVARWFNAQGVSAFVLRYRVGPRYRHPAPLADVQRAIRLVRSRAADYGLSPERIGVVGLSAGGHLAAAAGTRYIADDPAARDPVDEAGSRPDFLILAYPVISFRAPYAHQRSLHMLLGDNPDPKLIEDLSGELQVSSQTPPTFLFHGGADRSVPSENSVLFYMALRKAGVPAELHIYESAAHGVGLAAADPVVGTWPRRLRDWLQTRGLLRRPPHQAGAWLPPTVLAQ